MQELLYKIEDPNVRTIREARIEQRIAEWMQAHTDVFDEFDERTSLRPLTSLRKAFSAVVRLTRETGDAN
jgi:hypothetical protein